MKIMVYVTLRFEGLTAEILEKAIKKGLAKTKSELLRFSLLKLNEEYHVVEHGNEHMAVVREKSLIDQETEKKYVARGLELMHKGLNLGGGPYYKNRDELYDRFD